MFDLVQSLADDITDAITGADLSCQVERVTVTAGEYAPVANCNAVYVWADQISDGNEFDPDSCQVRPRLVLSYRVDVCYTEKSTDQTDVEHETVAECFYGLLSAIWCHLVGLKDDGLLLGVDDCADLTLGQLVVNDRAGAVVSATGTVTVPYHCTAS